MAGKKVWNNTTGFKGKLGGGGLQTICMTKTFGVPGCPRCAEATKFFADGDDDAGKKVYAKKAIFGWVKMVDNPSTPEKNGGYCLMEMPTNPVKAMMDKVESTDPDLAWPVPSDLDEGCMLVMSKRKGEQFPNYSMDIFRNKPLPISAADWAKIGPRLANVLDPLKLVRAIQTLGQKFLMVPRTDMKEGDNAKIRLMPVYGHEDEVPLGMVFRHYAEAETDWDRAWAEVNWDPSRIKEVTALLNTLDNGDDEAPYDPEDEDLGPAFPSEV